MQCTYSLESEQSSQLKERVEVEMKKRLRRFTKANQDVDEIRVY